MVSFVMVLRVVRVEVVILVRVFIATYHAYRVVACGEHGPKVVVGEPTGRQDATTHLVRWQSEVLPWPIGGIVVLIVALVILMMLLLVFHLS